MSPSGAELHPGSPERAEQRSALEMAVELVRRRMELTRRVNGILEQGLAELNDSTPTPEEVADNSTVFDYFHLPHPDEGVQVAVKVDAPVKSWPPQTLKEVSRVQINLDVNAEGIDEDDEVVPGIRETDLFTHGGITFHWTDYETWQPQGVTNQEALEFLELLVPDQSADGVY